MTRHLPRLRTSLASQRGAALIEFALVSIALYVLLAAGIEFGRLMFDANALQDVARVAARELATAPTIADATFEYALTCDVETDANCLVNLRRRVFDPACLVVDLTDPAVATDPDGYFAAMPVVNRSLRALMIMEPSRPGLLRYAGALVNDASGLACSAIGANGQAAATGLTVAIPLVEARDGSGIESISWLPVLEEIRAAADVQCPARGPFSLVYLSADDECGALDEDPVTERGLVAVRVNYPFQAATLSGYRTVTNSDGVPSPNMSAFILANDGAVQQNTVPPGPLVGDDGAIGPYAGAFGLGRQLTLAGRVVRPFRKVISAQSVFRREVIQ